MTATSPLPTGTTRDSAKLALADGTVVEGVALGTRGLTGGELCFNASMTGYQEIMTDPSYWGQLMMMTQPHIGNYGASAEDMEADEPMIEGFIVRDYPRRHSNTQADETLEQFMQRFGLVGIAGVDTRALVRHVRDKGVMNAVISSDELSGETLVQKAKDWPSMAGHELASKVTVEEPYTFCEGSGPRIAVYDFGVKKNILRSFRRRGCTVKVVPGPTDLSAVLDWNPDGLFFSNGPGDPRPMDGAIETVSDVIDTGLPIFGICLGHQLMALAEGFDVYKMHVGHRGANHPLKNVDTEQVEVTTQNHGFVVDLESIDPEVARVTHVNLNDDTIEGLRFKQFAGMSLQYHPEASPGPHDSHYHFDAFVELVAEERDVAVPEEEAERIPAVASA
ncbi:glutamine-hydrolyzing carbamoyl-phosphate synthase small subunit [Salinibacter ruber]|uniref:glutamine-hydrolyzing carbamoyl-phosphate synthase small subunit n=1 Tax=Salinibacter ruber TaxID=146919 RepID=UPI002166F9B8|nr:glutamine-hydrolyzing carbamoyl-phosphate synthase small subunit [Salinibacter ruber]MCS3685505.1 carbamoyl-phosphate synthase small subunit [Salinibacter ruber]